MKKLLLGLSLLVLGFSCARQSDNNNNQNLLNNGAFGQYQLNQFGQCVAVQTQQPVQTSLCQQNGQNGLYQLNQNGQCMSTQTGQIVSTQFCQQVGSGFAQQCYGSYSYLGVTYQCGITHNCSGYTVTSLQTGQQVLCQ
jgi:hypothetical protein